MERLQYSTPKLGSLGAKRGLAGHGKRPFIAINAAMELLIRSILSLVKSGLSLSRYLLTEKPVPSRIAMMASTMVSSMKLKPEFLASISLYLCAIKLYAKLLLALMSK